jgi:hypothetical protein
MNRRCTAHPARLQLSLGRLGACVGLVLAACTPAAPPAAPTPATAATSLDPDLQNIYQDAIKVIPNLPPDILAGAKKEGALSLYRLSYDVQDAYAEFNKLFPFVKITDFEGTTAGLLQRYSSEARANRQGADVVMN